jgi:hypothetical protein
MSLADGFRGSRARLRLRSLTWALLAGVTAASLALVWGVEAALRSAGCGFFYGLLAFHLQRVDPDDGHLQAGLVGAVCGIRSLAAPLHLPSLAAFAAAAGTPWPPLSSRVQWFQQVARAPWSAWPWWDLCRELAQSWLPLWAPLVASAVALRLLVRWLPALRP